MQQLPLLLAWCYYRHLLLCVTPALELAFPVSPRYSAALHPSGTCLGTALLCTNTRRMAAVNAGIQQTCSDTLTSVVEEMIHGRRTSFASGQLSLPKGQDEWLQEATASAIYLTPSGTCESPSILSRAVLPSEQGQADGSTAAVSRSLGGVHSLHFKPLQQTQPLPSKCPLQPMEKRCSSGTVKPTTSCAAESVGSLFLPTGCKEGAGN